MFVSVIFGGTGWAFYLNKQHVWVTTCTCTCTLQHRLNNMRRMTEISVYLFKLKINSFGLTLLGILCWGKKSKFTLYLNTFVIKMYTCT